MLPGNENQITAAMIGSQKAGNQEKVSCFLRPKVREILHRTKKIQKIFQNIAKFSFFPVVGYRGENAGQFGVFCNRMYIIAKRNSNKRYKTLPVCVFRA